MTKPIGYYCDTNIPLIAEIERDYGSNLDGMDTDEKIFLIYNIAQNLDSDNPCEVDDEFYKLANRATTEIFEETDAISLLKALVNSL